FVNVMVFGVIIVLFYSLRWALGQDVPLFHVGESNLFSIIPVIGVYPIDLADTLANRHPIVGHLFSLLFHSGIVTGAPFGAGNYRGRSPVTLHRRSRMK